MASDISRDLTVYLNSIIFNDGSRKPKTLLSETIVTFVDSTVPHIWLPRDSCTLFEEAFGITYNATIERYLVNDTLHTQMQHQNANVSFVLGNSVSNESVNIVSVRSLTSKSECLLLTLLKNTSPFVELTTKVNSHLEGRSCRIREFLRKICTKALMQTRYLIADYEHSNFSIFPVVSSENSTNSVPSMAQIVACSPANSTFKDMTVPSASTSASIPHPGLKISSRAISGFTVSAALICIIIASISFYIARKRCRR